MDRICRENQGLIRYFERKWRRRGEYVTDDSLQAASLGFVVAMHRYDPNMAGGSFIEFASWQIRHQVQEVRRRAGVVRDAVGIESLDEFEIRNSAESGTSKDAIPDESLPDPDRALDAAKVAAMVTRHLDCLSARERLTIEQRFLVAERKTTKTLAEEFEYTTQGVELMQKRALSKLRDMISIAAA